MVRLCNLNNHLRIICACFRCCRSWIQSQNCQI